VRLDWMHLQDEGAVGPSRTTTCGAPASWQSFQHNLRVDGWFSWPRRPGARLHGARELGRPRGGLHHDRQLVPAPATQQDRALEIDPYFTTLGELFPYHQGRLLASKGFGEHVNVQGVSTCATVEDQDDEGQFSTAMRRACSPR
jgi:hypothetical protein